MEYVSDLNQYNALINEVKKKSSPVYTNCYLFADVINKYIDEKRIFYKKNSTGVAFFYEEESFYHLYYYILLKDRFKIEKADKTIVIDLVYSGQGNQQLKSIIEYWESCGFTQYKTYEQYSLIKPKDELPADIDSYSGNYNITFARQNDLDSILSLWSVSLDVLSTALPTRKELSELIDTKQIACAVSKADGSVGGVMRIHSQRGITTISHIAVDTKHRQQGLATILYDFCIKAAADKSTKYCAWVDVNNLPSIRLHLKKGFLPSGRKTTQLILEDHIQINNKGGSYGSTFKGFIRNKTRRRL